MRAATILFATGLLATAIVNAIPVPHSRSHVARDNTPKLVFAITSWAIPSLTLLTTGRPIFHLHNKMVLTVTDAFQAAQNANSGFKLFFSFDMSVLPCNTPDGATTLRNFITTFSTHPNQFTMNGKVFASTFAGESCQFGQDTVADGWRSQFTQHPDLTGQNAVFFVPSFFVDPSTFPTFTGVMDGDYNFNSGWPVDLHTAQATQVVSAVGDNLDKLGAAGDAALSKFIGAFDTDTQHITDLALS
ncbi:Glucan endo-1,3-alpha-glucosidase agn1 [Grifola frondosa]|uniref:Glucan endo-1,3-alpha-glucosidase agn1 n=1 Tax=Grifola frondosa TaxID=5627 RepID=A0A1C7LWG5_GRIFR|nr:Glucan endo-1,3-alpha-glucosidase agn1 [Grifola frondosa]